MNATIEQRVTAFIRELAERCKRCPYPGASCVFCAINGVKGLNEDLKNNGPLELEPPESRKRKNLILSMLNADAAVPARQIKLTCTRAVKMATLLSMEKDSEIVVVRKSGRQNTYRLHRTRSGSKPTTETNNHKE